MNLELIEYLMKKFVAKTIYGQSLNEMATIGYVDAEKGSYAQRVYVNNEPRYKEPHFHYKYSKNCEYVFSIYTFDLLRNCRKNPLNRKIESELKEWLKKKTERFEGTNWEFLQFMWNMENPRKQIEIKKELPNG